MKRNYFLSLVASLGLLSSAYAADTTPSVGVVNFATCVNDSKIGKQEQGSFEGLKKQMGSLLEDTEKQLNEISTKFNDKEYLDGLSPEAEDELKVKFRTLSEDLNRYQSQYYQVLQQANMRLVHTLSSSIQTASEKVSKQKKLACIINKDACFYFSPQMDVTVQVVAEMDKIFEQEAKKPAVTAPATAQTAPAPAKTEETKK